MHTLNAINRNATKIVIATLLLVSSALAINAASPVINKTISNTGSITAIGVGIYWNQATTNQVTSIDWGTLDPGSNKTVTVYIQNEGDSAVSLSLHTSNWNPSAASDYLSLSWDYGGQSINVGEIVQVTFILSASASVEGIDTFGFDITIIAST